MDDGSNFSFGVILVLVAIGMTAFLAAMQCDSEYVCPPGMEKTWVRYENVCVVKPTRRQP